MRYVELALIYVIKAKKNIFRESKIRGYVSIGVTELGLVVTSSLIALLPYSFILYQMLNAIKFESECL